MTGQIDVHKLLLAWTSQYSIESGLKPRHRILHLLSTYLPLQASYSHVVNQQVLQVCSQVLSV